jgi:hypothetical protein
MAVAQNLTLRRPHPHPAPGLLGSLDPINGSGENPGVAATNRAIPCRFENNFGHERHSTGLPGIRQLGVEGQVSGKRGLEARNCTRTLRSTAAKAAVSGIPNGQRRVQIAKRQLGGRNKTGRPKRQRKTI